MSIEMPHIRLDIYVTERELRMLAHLAKEATKERGVPYEPEDVVRYILMKVYAEYRKKGFNV